MIQDERDGSRIVDSGNDQALARRIDCWELVDGELSYGGG
jgi:hypothetical protein